MQDVFTYDREKGLLFWKKPGRGRTIGKLAGSPVAGGYYLITVDRKLYLRHRIIWFLETGVWPEKLIDHIDTIPGHDWFKNLREATPSQNAMNSCSQYSSTSKIKGVSWSNSRMKWCASICVNGKRMFLGRFTTEKEAASVYNTAAVKWFGEFSSEKAPVLG